MAINLEIVQRIATTPFVDTHEHLFEESFRVERVGQEPLEHRIPSDFMLLFHGYAYSDFISAGMPAETMMHLLTTQISPKEKWRVLEPYYLRVRHTGYVRAARISLRMLLGEEDFSEDNCEQISARLSANIKPGYYKSVLRDISNIEYAQVHPFELPEKGVIRMPVGRVSEQPDLLAQDFATLSLTVQPDVKGLSRALDREVRSLHDWHDIIDTLFETYGPRAIATKNHCAYFRRLNFDAVSAEVAAPFFARYAMDAASLNLAEFKAVQDHLMHYCIDKAVEYDLPVKLHTGYYASNACMPLERLRNNLSDLCPILQAHPDARFILMHNTYPYQDELIAICKHYPNAYADMCWAWIINPAAGVRFVKEFLMAAPANKLFTFGGDYFCVENVPGHAAIARQGLAQALSELVDEHWLSLEEALELVPQLMNGNAHEMFDLQRTLGCHGPVHDATTLK